MKQCWLPKKWINYHTLPAFFPTRCRICLSVWRIFLQIIIINLMSTQFSIMAIPLKENFTRTFHDVTWTSWGRTLTWRSLLKIDQFWQTIHFLIGWCHISGVWYQLIFLLCIGHRVAAHDEAGHLHQVTIKYETRTPTISISAYQCWSRSMILSCPEHNTKYVLTTTAGWFGSSIRKSPSVGPALDYWNSSVWYVVGCWDSGGWKVSLLFVNWLSTHVVLLVWNLWWLDAWSCCWYKMNICKYTLWRLFTSSQ